MYPIQASRFPPLTWALALALAITPALAAAEALAPPRLSHVPGFYEAPIALSASHDRGDVVLRYTVDGSEPAPDSPVFPGTLTLSTREGEPNVFSAIPTTGGSDFWIPPGHPVFKANVIRVRAFSPGAAPSPAASGTYFIGPGVRDRYSFAVVSVLTDADNFFGDERGIYVPGTAFDGDPKTANYWQRGREWERPVHVEIFDESGAMRMAQDAGVRIHGGFTRRDAIKSLRFYARSDYGENRFRYMLFPDQPDDRYNRFILRNSGNDNRESLFRDAFMQRLVSHMRFDTQAYRPAVVFINGEYWGIQNFRERYDRRYLERVYDVDRENIDLLTLEHEVKEGNASHYLAMLNYIDAHGVAAPEHYAHVRTQMDVENFIDYNIAHIFVNNTDWPGNNLDYWRVRTEGYIEDAPYGHDGRWRWMVYDTDFGFWLRDDDDRRDPPSVNTLSFAVGTAHSWMNPGWSTFLFRELLLNTSFRNDFINRFADQLNTAFRPERSVPLIDAMRAALEPEIDEHIARHKLPKSRAYWAESIDRMRSFAAQRPDFQYQHIEAEFGLTGTYTLTVDVADPDAGRVRVNTITLDDRTPGVAAMPYPWSGRYFRGVPIEIEAVPEPGFRFLRWEGVEGGAAVTVTPQSNLSVRAVFEELPPGPFNLGAADYSFPGWGAHEPAGTYPPHVTFYQTGTRDPWLHTRTDGLWTQPYNLESRSRIVGFGERGFAFINTSNPQTGGGYVGAAVLTLNTREQGDIDVTWTGGTERPNSRIYNVRLQYRVGGIGPFVDVPDASGNPVEYRRNSQEGHSQVIGPVRLPWDAENRDRVQLRWKYYYTGIREDPESGQRSMLSVRDISVRSTWFDPSQPRSIFRASQHTFDLGGGWKWTGLGYMYDGFYPLVYAYGITSWMYVAGNSENGYYFWDYTHSHWAYTGIGYYPSYIILTGERAGEWAAAGE